MGGNLHYSLCGDDDDYVHTQLPMNGWIKHNNIKSRLSLLFLVRYCQVLEIACVDSKSEYDQVKAKRQHPGVADTVGAEVRVIYAWSDTFCCFT